MPLSPGHRIGPYEIVAPLGAGGMGEVYRANDTNLGRQVALKVLPPAFANDAERMARFKREAQTLAALNHPNIAAIYGIEGNAIVMELVEGNDLSGPLPIGEALPIARQIAEALEAAHEKQIIHRDLKPANIKVTPQGVVKLLDFGLAKAIADEPQDSSNSPTLSIAMTSAGMILGTAAYMSPEQAKGKPVDRRADIWAYGIVLLETLTGRRAYTGETAAETLAAVIKDQPSLDQLPATTPPAIRTLIARCLEKEPARRLPWIGEARAIIDNYNAVPAPEIPIAAPARSGVPIGAAALLGVLAIAGGATAFLHLRKTPEPKHVVRFEIKMPENSDSSRSSFAFSPDGTKLAFVTTNSDGESMVFVRSLDSTTLTPLAGTKGASFLPFWSPDGRSIGYSAGTKLVRIDLSGGAPQTICELPGPILSGTWSRDGVILFGTNVGGVHRVSQSGGAVEEITKPDIKLGELGHLRPSFLPDGRHFIYLSRTENLSNAIYLSSLDGQGHKKLATSQTAGVYVPPQAPSAIAHLLYIQGTTLFALPLHPNTFDSAGEAMAVAEGVGSRLALGMFAASLDGALAFRRGSAGSVSRLVWVDRQGKRVATIGEPASYSNVAVSPDGKRIAVSILNQNVTEDVWTIDAGRGGSQRFTFGPGRGRAPLWTPDGERVIYESEDVRGSTLFERSANGLGTERALVRHDSITVPESVSPDGKHLLFSRLNRTGIWELLIMPLAASPGSPGTPKPLFETRFHTRRSAFSPDGRWVAYISVESGIEEVYVQSFPPGGGKFQISIGGGTQPRWSPDGKEIFYFSNGRRMMAVSIRTNPRFEAGKPQMLFEIQQPVLSLAGNTYIPGKDGQRFLMITPVSEVEAPVTVVLNWTAALKQ